MAFIIFFLFVWKSLKKLKKLELSPQKFRYGVLHLLYSAWIDWVNLKGIFGKNPSVIWPKRLVLQNIFKAVEAGLRETLRKNFKVSNTEKFLILCIFVQWSNNGRSIRPSAKIFGWRRIRSNIKTKRLVLKMILE